MPKSISLEHINRMFPFQFYEELTSVVKEYIFLNPAIMAKEINPHIKKEEQKKLFDESRKNEQSKIIAKNNILTVEPIGEVLTLDLCYSKKEHEKRNSKENKLQQTPLSLIIVQLYDSTDQPVFSEDVSDETINKIPEVLWDDPNLFIGVVTFEQEGAKLAVLKIPQRIEDKIIEGKEK